VYVVQSLDSVCCGVGSQVVFIVMYVLVQFRCCLSSGVGGSPSLWWFDFLWRFCRCEVRYGGIWSSGCVGREFVVVNRGVVS
jgi:hypothetical protein